MGWPWGNGGKMPGTPRSTFSPFFRKSPRNRTYAGLGSGISSEIIEIIKHRKGTNGLDEVDAVVIELGREIFGASKVASATFARALRQFGLRALVDLVALIGNYAGTAALLSAFDMQLDPNKPPLVPPP